MDPEIKKFLDKNCHEPPKPNWCNMDISHLLVFDGRSDCRTLTMIDENMSLQACQELKQMISTKDENERRQCFRWQYWKMYNECTCKLLKENLKRREEVKDNRKFLDRLKTNLN